MFRRGSKPQNNPPPTPDDEQQSIDEAVGLFQQRQSENFAELQANKPTVMVVGRAGAGKSTLINAVFGEKVAKVGTGRPVTQNYTLYSNSETLVNIYDTRGWEGGADDEKIFYNDTRVKDEI